MSEASRIADQIRNALEGPAWHGPSLLEAIEGVTPEQAAKHPIPDAHSIWELLEHCGFWVEAARRRLHGEVVEPASEKENFPGPLEASEVSEGAWRRSVMRVRQSHAQLIDETITLSDARLAQPLANDWDVYATLHGAVQHTLYHAGQIAILKKLV